MNGRVGDDVQNSNKIPNKTEQALENKCPACNASISFNPEIGKWKCEYCGSVFSLEEINAANKKQETKSKQPEPEVVDEYNEYVSFKCNSCGAEIIADKETSATFCVYCGNTAILKSKLSGKFTPNKIIPFKTTKEQAIEAFKSLRKGRPLMPKDFNAITNIEKIKGVYIPFWLYDIEVSGTLKMTGKKITSWSRGDTHYTKTDVYELERGGNMDFDSIPVDGSTRFNNDIMNTIEPFDYKDMVPYNHAYLSGFFAEKYDTEGNVLFEEASKRAINSAKYYLESKVIGYSSVQRMSDNLEAKEEKREYALLPVWMVNVKYKDEMYIFAMNGQTGEFVGNIPLDKNKTIIFSIAIFIISLLVVILLSYIFFISGGN